jgi:hypothetical protein
VLPIAQASVLRWVLMGGISTNRIFFWHGLTGCVLVLVRQCCAPFGWVWWCRERAGAWFVWVVFGALLGPEATGPFCSNAGGHVLVFLLFLLPVRTGTPVCGCRGSG